MLFGLWNKFYVNVLCRYRDDVDHIDDIYKIQHFFFHNFVFVLS